VASALPGGQLQGLAALALLAALLGRGLSPALLGSTTGIERWILVCDAAAAFTGQLLLLSGSMFALLLLVATLRETRLGVVHRLTAAPAGAAVVTVALMSGASPIPWAWTLLLGVVSIVLAATGVPVAFRSARTRPVGVLLALSLIASLLQLGARCVAAGTGEVTPAWQFEVARGLATVALAVGLGAVVVAVAWIGQRRWGRTAMLAAVLVGASLMLGAGAIRGIRYGAEVWEVLAARILTEFVRQPTALVVPIVRYGSEAILFGAAAVVLVGRRGNPELSAGAALALLSCGSVDIPLLGLCLALSALILPLAAASDSQPVTGPSP
jgi:hypothetical protein